MANRRAEEGGGVWELLATKAVKAPFQFSEFLERESDSPEQGSPSLWAVGTVPPCYWEPAVLSPLLHVHSGTSWWELRGQL